MCDDCEDNEDGKRRVLELDELLFIDSSTSAKIEKTSPGLKINGSFTKMFLSVDATPVIKLISLPLMIVEMEYCLGVVPRVKSRPAACIITGLLCEKLIVNGLDVPVSKL